MFPPVQTVAPATVPVSVELMREHVRLKSAAEDVMLEAYLAAATSHLDGHAGVLGRCLVTQTWRQDFAGWPCAGERLVLPFPGVSAIDSVTYLDADGDPQMVTGSLYELVPTHGTGEVRFKDAFDWPEVDDDVAAPVSVTFTAGYGTADDVPWAIRVAIMLMAAAWYENRESVVVGQTAQEIPMAAGALLAPYRRLLK